MDVLDDHRWKYAGIPTPSMKWNQVIEALDSQEVSSHLGAVKTSLQTPSFQHDRSIQDDLQTYTTPTPHLHTYTTPTPPRSFIKCRPVLDCVLRIRSFGHVSSRRLKQVDRRSILGHRPDLPWRCCTGGLRDGHQDRGL